MRVVVAGVLLLGMRFLPLAVPIVAQGRHPKIDSLAGDLARKIEMAQPRDEKRRAAVPYLVFDFQERDGRITQLGVHLADSISEALRNEASAFNPVPRSRLLELCERERVDLYQLESDRPAAWAAKTLGAGIAILGSIEPRDGQFNLHLRVIDNNSKEIADDGELLDWTEEMRGWSKLYPPSLPLVGPRPGIPEAGRQGYSMPQCIYCPNPPYTEAARKEGIAGEFFAYLVIGADGRVQDAAPVRGLLYGLTGQTVATMKSWKFRPAVGPDGKPAIVQIPVEVNFRINSFR